MRSVNSQRFSVISSFQLEARETVYSWLTRGQTGFRLSSLRGADHQEKWWRGDSVAARDLIYIYIYLLLEERMAQTVVRETQGEDARDYTETGDGQVANGSWTISG